MRNNFVKRFPPFIFFFSLIFLTLPKSYSQTNTFNNFEDNNKTASQIGPLFLFGGGPRSASALKTFAQKCERATTPNQSNKNSIVIITDASQYPEEAFAGISEDLSPYYSNQIIHLNCTKSPTSCLLLSQKEKCFFFSGGDQNRLRKIFLATTASEILKDSLKNIKNGFFKKGNVIGGTSAGTAFMAETMLTGEDFSDSNESSIQKNIIGVSQGGAFLKNILIDQHFIKRKRWNRLISSLWDHSHLSLPYSENPLYALAIDEGACALVTSMNDHSRKIQSVGKTQVILMESLHSSVNSSGLYGGEIIIKILLPGQLASIK